MELLWLRGGGQVAVNLGDPNPSVAAGKLCTRLVTSNSSLKARWYMGTQEGRGF